MLEDVWGTEVLPNPPHISGPTWQRTIDGAWLLPKKTLGWGVLDWWSRYVKTPAGENSVEVMEMLFRCNRPLDAFVPTDEQTRFTLWWYAVDDNGDYTFREGVLRRLKGWGKDPFAAALSLAELCGPVAFAYFDDRGEPVGKRRHAAWIQVAAVSQDQTKNTFGLFPIMISKQLKRDYALEINKTILRDDIGGKVEAITSSAASMEGNRPTFAIKNEIQWWGCGPDFKVNDGHAISDVIDGNLSKTKNARSLSICNAHIPGNDTVGEKAYDSWQDVASGKVVYTGIMYDALEAPADTPLSEIPSKKEDPEGYEAGVQKLREGLIVARGDSVWLPIEQILLSCLDSQKSVTEQRRKFLNQVNAHEDSWISPVEWDRLALVDPLFALKPGERITMGFDGSKSNDWTALVACRVHDGVLFLLNHWNPSLHPNEKVPSEDVDAAVRSAFEKYEVVGFRADVKEFEAYVDQWSTDFGRKLKVNASPGNPIAFDMRGQTKRFALDCERFVDAVTEREVYHNDNKTLRAHILNARRHPTVYDAISIRKASKDSSKKIDAAVCAVLAFGGRQDFLMSKNNRSGKAVVIR